MNAFPTRILILFSVLAISPACGGGSDANDAVGQSDTSDTAGQSDTSDATQTDQAATIDRLETPDSEGQDTAADAISDLEPEAGPEVQVELVCVPDCSNADCGDDGCGGTCGQCEFGFECQEGLCICTTGCDGDSCPEDGCAAGLVCNDAVDEGTCLEPAPAGEPCADDDHCQEDLVCNPESEFCCHTDELEMCNGEDDDCDEEIDEELGDTTCGLGECENTITNCIAGEPQACDPMLGAVDEVCDGLDNNCDGDTDEELGETTCGLGECEHTVPNCVDGQPQECDPMEGAMADFCNDLDDDCDGKIDEDFVAITPLGPFAKGEECGTGVCMGGTVVCDSPILAICSTEAQAADEMCNGEDDDCDGEVDEDLPPLYCGLGVCEKTVPACIDGITQVCDPMAGAIDEVCDGLDNNCEGNIDEELGETTCGLGVCEHTVPNCQNGAVVPCDPVAGAELEKCDGLDNNCEGNVDEEVVCDDNLDCTVDSCGGEQGCLFQPVDGNCDDLDACNGVETCDAVAGCVDGVALECEDTGNPCIAGSCDPGLGCIEEMLEPCCGNLIVEPGEICDDGNQEDLDGCSAGCLAEGGQDCGPDLPCGAGTFCGLESTCVPYNVAPAALVEGEVLLDQISLVEARAQPDVVYFEIAAVTGAEITLLDPNAPGLAAGDDVLAIVMQGTLLHHDLVGVFQRRAVAKVAEGIVTLAEPLDSPLTDLTPETLAAQPLLLVRIPHFLGLELATDAVLSVSEWNGTSAGVLPLHVDGTIALAEGSAISVDSKGFSGGGGGGGQCSVGSPCAAGSRGESIAAFGGTGVTEFLGGGGGGWSYHCGTYPGDCGGGGGGGAHVGAGENGSGSNKYGNGGNSYADADPVLLMLGAGGGGGAADATGAGDTQQGRSGGEGGGILLLDAVNLTGTGLISANGEPASLENCGKDLPGEGGGGGGGGGTVVLTLAEAQNDVTVTANGGQAADGCCRCGGAGGSGLMVIPDID